MKTHIFRDSNEHELDQNVAKSERNSWEVGLLRAELGSEDISKKQRNHRKSDEKRQYKFYYFVVFC